MNEVPDKIPDGFKFYNFTYKWQGRKFGGGFCGSDPDAVYDVIPLSERPDATDVEVKEVSREEFIKTLRHKEKSKWIKNFRFFEPEHYGYNKQDWTRKGKD